MQLSKSQIAEILTKEWRSGKSMPQVSEVFAKEHDYHITAERLKGVRKRLVTAGLLEKERIK